MTSAQAIDALIASRKGLRPDREAYRTLKNQEAEGGCGVIGIACSEQIPARHLLQALQQMRNRGNNKGGGIAAVGLVPEELGVSMQTLENDYLLSIAYLEPSARAEVERVYVESTFEVDAARCVPVVEDMGIISSLEVRPPEVHQYFVRVKEDVIRDFLKQQETPAGGGMPLAGRAVEDEIVYQNSYLLNRAYYASAGDKKAFVLSHGKNMMVLKMVGYGDDVVRYYRLEDIHAHVWIGHHRYPTKGRVWHPGGAHPFVGLHEALVHNGDFANYSSLCEYLGQRNIFPLFLTDTEVSALIFDLLYRVYRYPLEYVIEALAPTTERDFTMLPRDKREIYRMLQTTHMHGSPDGPWFFLIAQCAQELGEYRLIGITDTSMLRPQVFAIQEGQASIGFAASEKQAIDAALDSLASEDSRFWSRADRYWNARGGSHTDGGAFVFSVRPGENAGDGKKSTLICSDKFGRRITADTDRKPYVTNGHLSGTNFNSGNIRIDKQTAEELFAEVATQLTSWNYAGFANALSAIEQSALTQGDFNRAIGVLTHLLDRRYPTGSMRRSCLLSLCDERLASLFEALSRTPNHDYSCLLPGKPRPVPGREDQTLLIDARPFPPEGEQGLGAEIRRLHAEGWHRFLVAHTRGHRFIANGLGPNTDRVRIDVYGTPGDYLASGIDGAQVIVHGNAQDQLGQIMKGGTLIVYGDVGQTFMYGAKGGNVFVLGNAAGRPLINAVGKPRVVINGTCLDYLAESFMAGDPYNGGGFVILNGIGFDDDGMVVDLETPYPGGNLFSLASGGAIYIRDPRRKVSEEQLNGGGLAELEERDWELIKPLLMENERLFGVPVNRLLEVDGEPLSPGRVYRKIFPRDMHALQAEEAWVRAND
jgi:glutamate synthase domain-containing protein 1/glutamate synthase domain-containing protein 3